MTVDYHFRTPSAHWLTPLVWCAIFWGGVLSFAQTNGQEAPAAASAASWQGQIRPLLETYCFGCHSGGTVEGKVAFDAYATEEALQGDRPLWWAVLKNVRANVMPPASEAQPSAEERQMLVDWIERTAFGIDPHRVDPGRVTIHRLNRLEYAHTVRDLMGVDFPAEVVFPPDDTGFGFDNIGDALSLSPLLLEKYLQAAVTIVEQGVPLTHREATRRRIGGREFTAENSARRGNDLSVYEATKVAYRVPLEVAGDYRVTVRARIDGSFDFDPGRGAVEFSLDGESRHRGEYRWEEDLKIEHVFNEQWNVGEHLLEFTMEPLNDANQERNNNTAVHYRVEEVIVEGPLDPAHWTRPSNYDRFFPRPEPPTDLAERRGYAREVLERFARRAYRRPLDEASLEKLVQISESVYTQPNKTFEAGVAQAMTAVLASPRFLFRWEETDPADAQEEYPRLDEYSLASRLSYFLWSTMPDDELFELAARGELRQNLDAQVMRMLASERSEAFVRNFTGQWLRARDIEGVSIDALAATGAREEWEDLRRRFGRRRFDPSNNSSALAPEVRQRFEELAAVRNSFDAELRQAMRRETEMSFAYVVRENRSVLELINSNYTFLNEKLAKFYGVPGVEGPEMRRVELPENSPRGGLLTQGTMLAVTSNPTRTSPVKRGLFILDNVLGTPAPPAPPNVPELEASADEFGDRKPTLREVLELHRASSLCASCHARMDPLGLALENFNALGAWREMEQGQPIQPAGALITGESFANIQELKTVLSTTRRLDFYRCLTQKMLTYALGRGLDYYDEWTVDQIVNSLDRTGGEFQSLLRGVVNSAPFQRTRRASSDAAASISGDES